MQPDRVSHCSKTISQRSSSGTTTWSRPCSIWRVGLRQTCLNCSPRNAPLWVWCSLKAVGSLMCSLRQPGGVWLAISLRRPGFHSMGLEALEEEAAEGPPSLELEPLACARLLMIVSWRMSSSSGPNGEGPLSKLHYNNNIIHSDHCYEICYSNIFTHSLNGT